MTITNRHIQKAVEFTFFNATTNFESRKLLYRIETEDINMGVFCAIETKGFNMGVLYAIFQLCPGLSCMVN